jgi:hypothetical protein
VTDQSEHITESLRRDEWEAREVFLKFGEAIYFCQVLEFQLITYAQWIRRFRKGEPLTAEEVEQLQERLISATFGRNYGEVRDLLDGQWNLSQQMKDAVDLRNDLVHHWMRQRQNGFDTHASRLQMIAELEAAARQLQAMADDLLYRIRGFLRVAGVDEAQIQAEVDRLSQS